MHGLAEFLQCSQSIIDTFVDREKHQNFLNIFILKSILNKLRGNAKTAVNINHVTTWDEVRDTLNRNFGDQRDEVCLIRDLVLLKQNNESPTHFYDRIITILNLLCSYIKNYEPTEQGKIIKKDLYKKLALKTFLAGLSEPLGSAIRAMRPEDLQAALAFINEERNVRYYQKTNINYNNKQDSLPNKNNFPFNPIKIQSRQIPQKFPSNEQVFGKQFKLSHYPWYPKKNNK